MLRSLAAFLVTRRDTLLMIVRAGNSGYKRILAIGIYVSNVTKVGTVLDILRKQRESTDMSLTSLRRPWQHL